MGCWNGTCMISNLPIIAGEKIKLVFLQQGFNKQSIIGQSSYVYSTALLSPAFLPISGNYDDYGTIESIDEDWNYTEIESTLKKKFGNSIIADGEEIENWKLPDLIRGIERAGSYTTQPQYLVAKTSSTGVVTTEEKDCDLSWVMIRQDVWDMCVDLQAKSKDYWNSNKVGNDSYYISGAQFADRQFDSFIQRIKRVFADPLEELRNEIMSMSDDTYIFGTCGREAKLLMADYKRLCRKNRDDDKFLQDAKKRWYELTMIEDCISNLRKGWIIQPGGGSQAQDWMLYKKFHIGLNAICDANHKNY